MVAQLVIDGEIYEITEDEMTELIQMFQKEILSLKEKINKVKEYVEKNRYLHIDEDGDKILKIIEGNEDK